MIGLHAGLGFCFRYRHFAGFGEQFGEMAVMLGIEVLDEYKCHAGIVRQVAE
jgi:hypothetical protein